MYSCILRLYLACSIVVLSATSAPSIVPTSAPSSVRSSLNNINTIIGTGSASSSNAGASGTSTSIKAPRSVFEDTLGYLYFTDNVCVRKILLTAAIVIDIAGACGPSGSYSGDGGPSTSATLNPVIGMVVDTLGNVYFSDGTINRVRKASISGTMSLFAGSGTVLGDNGPATSASVGNPLGLWTTSNGLLYIANHSNCRIRMVYNNIISTFAGIGTSGYTGDGGVPTSAEIFPLRVVVDSSDQMYITTENSRVRKISSNIVSTAFGSSSNTFQGDSIAATSTGLNTPTGISIDRWNGDVYVSDYGLHRVLVLTASSNLVSTFAGNGVPASTGDGGQATAASISNPDGNFLNTDGVFLLADKANNRIRYVYTVIPTQFPTSLSVPSMLPTVVPSAIPTSSPILQSTFNVYAFAGKGSSSADNIPATAATLPSSNGVFADSVNRVYIADTSKVRRVDAGTGLITTYAGTGTSGTSGNGGPATSANVVFPEGIWCDSVANCYFTSSTYAYLIRRIDSNGIISTYVGTGVAFTAATAANGDGGAATSASTGGIKFLAGDSVGNLYLPFWNQCKVRKVSSSSIITTYLGTGTAGWDVIDWPATSALLQTPTSVFVNTLGDLYLSDESVGLIQVVYGSSQIVSCVAGTGSSGYTGENLAATSGKLWPTGIYADGNGVLFIAEHNNNRYRMLASGIVTTIAGTGVSGTTGSGGSAKSAQFACPWGVWGNSLGVLYVSEGCGQSVRQLVEQVPTASPTVVPTLTPTSPTIVPSIVPSAPPTGVQSAVNIVFTYAGTGTASSTGTGGAATATTLNRPISVWQDTSGVVYVSEELGNCVRKIDALGIVYAFAGVCSSSNSFSGDNGPATSALLAAPIGLIVSTVGVAYVADFSNNRVRSVFTSGIIATYVGSGSASSSGDGGAATAAGIYDALGLWVNSAGVVYVSSYNVNRVRVVSVSGIISVFAGTGTFSYSGDGGQATAATLYCPERLFGDSTGVVYISDMRNNRLRSVSVSGIIRLIMGTGNTVWGNENVAATSASINFPVGMWKDTSNNDVYVGSREGHRVLVMTATTGLVSTFAGTGTAGSTGDGGAATSATLNGCHGLYTVTGGVMLLAEILSHKIRRVSAVVPTGSPTAQPTNCPTLTPTITTTSSPSFNPSVFPTGARSAVNNIFTYAGTGTGSSTGTGGAATAATMNRPRSVWQDTSGVVYVTEEFGNCVRKIDALGIVYAFAGVCSSSNSFSGDNGPATSARFASPLALIVSTVGVAYVAEFYNNRVRSVSSGIIATYVGSGSASSSGDGGAATAAGIYNALGLWVNSAGVVYVSSYGSNLVRVVSVSGIINLFAGTGLLVYSGDGGQATAASFYYPEKLYGDSTGVVYISDMNNNRLRSVSVAGIISLMIGSGNTVWGSENVAATSANLKSPVGMWKDTSNNDVYVGSREGHRVLVMTATTGLVSTFAGTGTAGSTGDGGAATSATLNGCDGLYAITGGKFLVWEAYGYRIRQVSAVIPTGMPTVLPTVSVSPTVVPSYNSPVLQYPYVINAFAGRGTLTAEGISATSASISPYGVFAATTGKVYLGDLASRVRVVDTSGIISTFAGTGTLSTSGDGGPATSANVVTPVGVWGDSVGNVYVSSNSNAYVIRKINGAGIISSYAGTNVEASSATTANGDGGAATAGMIGAVKFLCGDTNGNLYLPNNSMYKVRKVTPSGIISTIAGTGVSGTATDGSSATATTLTSVQSVFADSVGNLYITAEDIGKIHVVNSAQIISLVAGTGSTTFNGNYLAATSTQMVPTSMFMDLSGVIFTSEYSLHRFRVIAAGIVATIAGTGSAGTTGDGGLGTAALVNSPFQIWGNTNGVLFATEAVGQAVRILSSLAPTSSPTIQPNFLPSLKPTISPTPIPSVIPTAGPTIVPIVSPTHAPSLKPTLLPTVPPSFQPTLLPTKLPSLTPTFLPTCVPTLQPSVLPSLVPTAVPSVVPTCSPILQSTFNVYAFAGKGSSSADNIPATAAALPGSCSVFADSVNRVYIADTSKVRRVDAVTGIITTYAGTGTSGTTGNGGPATSANLVYPEGIWCDSMVTCFVSTELAYLIRKIDSNGIISTHVGTGVAFTVATAANGDGGAATSAAIGGIKFLAGDSIGNLYLPSFNQCKVRKVSSSGSIITTYAGTGAAGWDVIDRPATSALLQTPMSVFANTLGDLYLSDESVGLIQVVYGSSQVVSRVAGTGSSGYTGENLAATSGKLWSTGIYVDGSGVLFMAEYNNNRYRMLASGIVTTIAGTGVSGTTGSGGSAKLAQFACPWGVWGNSVGVLYVSEDCGQSVRQLVEQVPTASPTYMPSTHPSITPTFGPTQLPSIVRSTMNNIYLVAGAGSESSTGTGGLATAANLNKPRSVWLDSANTLYWTEQNGFCVRKMSTFSNIVQDHAGVCGTQGLTFSLPATSAKFSSPSGVVGDTAGGIYISDYAMYYVMKVSSGGMLNVYGGNNVNVNAGDGKPATSASINVPFDVWLDSISTLYIGEYNGFMIRGISAAGIIRTVAGTGGSGFAGDNGPATSASLSAERVFGQTTGVIFFSDSANSRIRQISISGIISTIAGTGSTVFNGESIAATSANFKIPSGIAVDTSNFDMYISDRDNYRLKVWTKTTGLVTTFAGTGIENNGGNGGAATSCTLESESLQLDTTGRLFFNEFTFHDIRVIYSVTPTRSPTVTLTLLPSLLPTAAPSFVPTYTSTLYPTACPSLMPTVSPSRLPSLLPSCLPTAVRTVVPTIPPSMIPTLTPSADPSLVPSMIPTMLPTLVPTLLPSVVPSTLPTLLPSLVPSIGPSISPSASPSTIPSMLPTPLPSTLPSVGPTLIPSCSPSLMPSAEPSLTPTLSPSLCPSVLPSTLPTLGPTLIPSVSPSLLPSVEPSIDPSINPSICPSVLPSVLPSALPSEMPSVVPSINPTVIPSLFPTMKPSTEPTMNPTESPTTAPSDSPSVKPTVCPTVFPSLGPTVVPTRTPTYSPSNRPTLLPSVNPSAVPSIVPSLNPSVKPTVSPTVVPTLISNAPLITQRPTSPTLTPTIGPTVVPSRIPSLVPSLKPTQIPVPNPTMKPSRTPTLTPSVKPTRDPTISPSRKPTSIPVVKPTLVPSIRPSAKPTRVPTTPTVSPTEPRPSISPSPTVEPSVSFSPTVQPTELPTFIPTVVPSLMPTTETPSAAPTETPSQMPTTEAPSLAPSTQQPSAAPSTVEYYSSHPKATLPSNQSISVVGGDSSFKIVLPFLSMYSGPNGIVFSDIVLGAGTTGVSFTVSGGSSLASTVSLALGVNSFANGVGVDSAKRTVSVVKDFNGDGYDDLIIGNPFFARCYVMYGTNLGLTNMTKGFTIFGTDGDLAGWSVSGAGDFNNDTMQDIVIGAPFAKGTGAVYVIYGQRSMVDVYLNNLTSSQGFALYGAQKSDYFGISVSNAGDVNNDGCDDIVMGMVGTAAYLAGAAYIVYGGRGLQPLSTIAQLSLSQGYKLTGVWYMYAGYSVSAAGDVNKDGYQDVVIGSCPQRSSLTMTSFIVFGAPSASITGNVQLTDLSATQGIRVFGAGVIVCSVGDLEFDGFADVLLTSSASGSDMGGLIVYTSTANLQALSAKPSVFPTARPTTPGTLTPSIRPTRQPFSNPTLKPVPVPSFLPTGPTEQPVEGTQEPTMAPSAEPSAPSNLPSSMPSVITEEPSMEPSEPPTVPPTLEPSEAPSMFPTIEPSESPSETPSNEPTEAPSSTEPSFSPITRRPIGLPTLLPTEPVTLPLLQEYVITGESPITNNSDVIANIRYVVNATGYVGVVSSRGANTYYIVPQTNLTLTIWNFNQSIQVIDLTLYKSIHSIKDLTITAGSINIRLSSTDLIHILNLEPDDVSDRNFVFAEPVLKDDMSWLVKVMLIVIPIGIVIGGAFYVYRAIYWSAEKVAAEVYPNKLVMVYSSTAKGEYVFKDEEEEEVNDKVQDIENQFNSRESDNLSAPANAATANAAGAAASDDESSKMSSFNVSTETVEVPDDFEVKIDDIEDSNEEEASEDDISFFRLSDHTLDSNGDLIPARKDGQPADDVDSQMSDLSISDED